MASKYSSSSPGRKKTLRRLRDQLDAITARLDALESRLDDPARTAGAPAARASDTPPHDDDPQGAQPSAAQPLDAPVVDPRPVTDRAEVIAADAEPPSDPFWALRALKALLPDAGGVVYAVNARTARGRLEYQWGRPTEHLLDQDWSEAAEPLGALGHPLRLSILRLLVDADRTVAQLVDELQLGSTGVAYHHLSALQAGGWVTSPRRGLWSVPPTRAVSLLTILTALERP